MDVFLVSLIVAFVCALCLDYVANAKINKFVKFAVLLLFIVFIFFGFFVFVFFLTFFFLFVIKYVRFAKNLHFKNKFVFLTALIALFFTYGFVFDGFKIAKFEYECNVKKNFKVEILNSDYTVNDLQNIWWKDSEIYKKCDWDYEKCPKNTNLIHKSNLYTNNKKFIGKIYQYYMPYNHYLKSQP